MKSANEMTADKSMIKRAGPWRCVNNALGLWVRDSQIPDKDAARAQPFKWEAYPDSGHTVFGDAMSLEEAKQTADANLSVNGWTLESKPIGPVDWTAGPDGRSNNPPLR